MPAGWRKSRGRVAFQLDLDVLFRGQPGVVLLQYLGDFGATEFNRQILPFGQHRAHLGAGQQDAVLLGVRAGALRGHAAALVAPEGPVDVHVLGFERALGDVVEDLLCVERAVVVTDTRVVAADDQMRTAIVLAEQGVQQGFARAGVAHVQRVAGLDDGIRYKVVIDQGGDGFGTDFGGNVTRLQRAQQRMDQYAVHRLDGDLGQ